MSFQRFEKIEWEPAESLMFLPAPKRHTVDCPNCNFRHPVQPEFTDWREVSERYRQSYSGMASAFMRLLKEAGDVFNLPLMEYYEASQLEMKQLLRELLDKSKEEADKLDADQTHNAIESARRKKTNDRRTN